MPPPRRPPPQLELGGVEVVVEDAGSGRVRGVLVRRAGTVVAAAEVLQVHVEEPVAVRDRRTEVQLVDLDAPHVLERVGRRGGHRVAVGVVHAEVRGPDDRTCQQAAAAGAGRREAAEQRGGGGPFTRREGGQRAAQAEERGRQVPARRGTGLPGCRGERGPDLVEECEGPGVAALGVARRRRARDGQGGEGEDESGRYPCSQARPQLGAHVPRVGAPPAAGKASQPFG